MTDYDCTDDVLEHKRRVKYFMYGVAQLILHRMEDHDNSKLLPPEKQMYDIFTPKLKALQFGSEEYKAALSEMGEALKHHYSVNRHHPEFWPDGISGMTLYDIIEMFCDWQAAADARHVPVNLEALRVRFGIGEQLMQIFYNTLKDDDFWFAVNGAGIELAPKDEGFKPYNPQLLVERLHPEPPRE